MHWWLASTVAGRMLQGVLLLAPWAVAELLHWAHLVPAWCIHGADWAEGRLRAKRMRWSQYLGESLVPQVCLHRGCDQDATPVIHG